MAAPTIVSTREVAGALHRRRATILAALLERRRLIPFFAGFNDASVATFAGEAERVLDVLLVALEEEREVEPEDVAFLVQSTADWSERGGRVEDIGGALRQLSSVIFDALADTAAGSDGRVALAVAARVTQLADVATVVVSESWGTGSGPDQRRALLEALLAGRPCSEAQLRGVGLEPRTEVLVVCAGAPAGRAVSALGALARAGRPATLPLAAVREGDELVVLRVVPAGGLDELLEALERSWRRLADGGARLAAGISAVHVVPESVPAALHEARTARERVSGDGGILALPRLTALDWLAVRADETSWRLVDPRVRAFLEEDAAADGQLLVTLRGYLASDLNLKATARRLHLHVNTVRYRLARIGERTGLDLRSLDDLVALVVAMRLQEAR